MRPLPDAGRGKYEDAKSIHDGVGQRRTHQNRMVLVIVVNNEHPDDEQARNNTAQQAK